MTRERATYRQAAAPKFRRAMLSARNGRAPPVVSLSC